MQVLYIALVVKVGHQAQQFVMDAIAVMTCDQSPLKSADSIR